MSDELVVTGIVLYTDLHNDYDKRLVVLTVERGKITIFANGARRQNSIYRAACQSFVMGKFTVRPGRNSYNLIKAEVSDYFTEISQDMDKLCYASYFGELMSYYTREGDFCKNNLNLLYFTLKALVNETVPERLIRCIYEVKLMDIEGQAIHAFNCVKCGTKDDLMFFDAAHGGVLCMRCAMKYKITKQISNTLLYTLQFILSSPLNSLYTFNLENRYLKELEDITDRFRRQYVDREFKSLDILESLKIN